MSTPRIPPKRIPRHGTRSRYRLEIKPGPDGVKGKPCDSCKEANRKASAAARASRNATARRGQMHLVEDPPADTSVDANADTPPSENGDAPKPGPMETAIEQDLAEEEGIQVPMHRSLSVLARQLARDFDKAESSTARTNASRQLSEVIKSLRTRREGDGNTALDLVLDQEGFGLPLVPGGSA